jgi:hypothetical protein
MPRPIAEKVDERSGGMCEICHRRPATDKHHRLFLSRGGEHLVENIVAACGGSAGMAGGNHSGCHGRAHSGKALPGTAISRYERRPIAEIELVDAYGYRWLFHPDGTKEKVGQLAGEEQTR